MLNFFSFFFPFGGGGDIKIQREEDDLKNIVFGLVECGGCDQNEMMGEKELTS